MRIAFVSIQDPADVRVWSGIPFYFLDALRRHNEATQVIAPLNRSFRFLFAPQKLWQRFTRKSLHVDRHPVALESYARQIARALQGKEFDIILSLSSVPISRLKPGTPVIFWTDAILEGMKDYYTGAFSGLSSRELRIGHNQEQLALSRASYAVYSSEWAANTAKAEYQVDPERVQVIRFGANLPILHDSSTVQSFIESRITNPMCVLLFIGVDWERKGGAIALETARILNRRGITTVLKVVGCNAPEEPFLQQFGFISKQTPEGQRQFLEILRTATFLMFPTRAEAAGIVFCEASAFGLPIVTTATGGVESYVRNSETGFCLPLTAGPIEYADIVEKTVRSPLAYRQLSMGAFMNYEAILNWDSAVTQLLALARKAVEQKHASG